MATGEQKSKFKAATKHNIETYDPSTKHRHNGARASDQAPVDLSIVIATDKILADFELRL